jgi:hypothetical protein
MKILKQSFGLLDGFSCLSRRAQNKRIRKIDHLLRVSSSKALEAQQRIRELDQLQKQRAYMLIVAGQPARGIKQIQSLVAEYERKIADLHEEASFQLAEATLACFRCNRGGLALALARDALGHAGAAKRFSRTFLAAIEQAQQRRETKGRADRRRARTVR